MKVIRRLSILLLILTPVTNLHARVEMMPGSAWVLITSENGSTTMIKRDRDKTALSIGRFANKCEIGILGLDVAPVRDATPKHRPSYNQYARLNITISAGETKRNTLALYHWQPKIRRYAIMTPVKNDWLENNYAAEQITITLEGNTPLSAEVVIRDHSFPLKGFEQADRKAQSYCEEL